MRTTLSIAAALLALAGCQRDEAGPVAPGSDGSGIKPVDAVPLPDDAVVMHPNDMAAAAAAARAKPAAAPKAAEPEEETAPEAEAAPAPASPPPPAERPDADEPPPEQISDPEGQ